MKAKYHYATKSPILPPEGNAKVGFVHLPKTGGTFLYAWIRLLGGCVHYFQHNPARMVTGYGLPLVGLVRNPFAWYVSRYFYFRKCLAVEAGVSRHNDAGLPCADFCEKFPTFKHHMMFGIENELPAFTFTQMYTRMFTHNGRPLMWRIGKTKNMYGFMEQMLIDLDIKPNVPFRDFWSANRQSGNYANKSEHEKYDTYYDRELTELVWKQDGILLSRYNYELGN